MTRFLLVRHGESEWNALGRWQGWADPPLSGAGEAQSWAAAPALAGLGDAVASSDLLRAVRTAEIFAEALGLPAPVVEPGLREINVGAWEGVTRAEMDERFPGMLQRWRTGELERPPGGESRPEFLERILGALTRLADAHPGASLIAVTHGGVIHTLERHLGVWDGTNVGNLGARWFEAASSLRVGSGRLALN